MARVTNSRQFEAGISKPFKNICEADSNPVNAV
jgi:hypothetical protein